MGSRIFSVHKPTVCIHLVRSASGSFLSMTVEKGHTFASPGYYGRRFDMSRFVALWGMQEQIIVPKWPLADAMRFILYRART